MEVLVVDDDDDATELMALLLKRRQYLVTTANSISHAKSLLESGRFSALVTDLHLPDGLGLDLLEKGRPNGLIKAIVVTGAADDLARGLPPVFDLCLKKPVDSLALLRALPTAKNAGRSNDNESTLS